MFFSSKVYTLWSLRNSMTFSNFAVKCNAEVCFNIRRTRAFLENFLFSLEKKILLGYYSWLSITKTRTSWLSRPGTYHKNSWLFKLPWPTQTLFTIQPPDRVLNLTTDKEKNWTGKCTLIVMKFFRDLDILHPSIVKWPAWRK